MVGDWRVVQLKFVYIGSVLYKWVGVLAGIAVFGNCCDCGDTGASGRA